MAAYPSITLIASSTSRRDGGQQPRRASNGALKVQRFYTLEKMEFDLSHWATKAEAAALEAHYQGHKDGSFPFVWPDDGVSRTCAYASPPLQTTGAGPDRVYVAVKLMEV